MENQNMMSGGMTSNTKVIIALIIGLVLGFVISSYMPKSNQPAGAINSTTTSIAPTINGGYMCQDYVIGANGVHTNVGNPYPSSSNLQTASSTRGTSCQWIWYGANTGTGDQSGTLK